MKSLLQNVPRFALAALALFAMVWTAPLARAQTTITLAELLAQGFTNGLAGYTLRVTGLRNGSSAVFGNIFQDGSGQVRAHSGNLQLYELNYAVTLAWVDTTSGGQLSFNGQMSLFPPFNTLQAQSTVQPDLVVDRLGNVRFAGGTFTIPYTFQIGSLTIENVMLTIDAVLQTFGGGADVGIGGGPTAALCTPAGSKRIHGDFLVVGGKLSQLGVGGNNLKQPLGTSGAILDSLGGTVGNLAINGGRNWFLQEGVPKVIL